MKKFNLQFLIASCSLLISSQVLAATQNFPATTAGNILITEQVSPPTYPINSFAAVVPSLNVTIPGISGVWMNNVTSAILKVCLSDDLSTNFRIANGYHMNSFDAPREWANISNIQYASASTPPEIVEVYLNPIPLPDSGAAAAGIENPDTTPSASERCYDVNVTTMLDSSNSGTLSFDLTVDARYSEIPSSMPIWGIIDAASPKPIDDPVHVWEDYVYDSAELIVTYDTALPAPPENIPTLSEWAMILMMLALAGFAATRLKES